MEIYNDLKINPIRRKLRRISFIALLLLTGLAKLESIKTYLSALLENDVKILIFAHHQAVMDDIDEHLQKSKVEYMRIDGNTSNENRKKNIKNFQENNSVRAALLSMSSLGSRNNLNSSFNCCVCRTHWTPANLIQAEDRHIG